MQRAVRCPLSANSGHRANNAFADILPEAPALSLGSADYRLAFWLANITFEPLAQIIDKLGVSDEAAKVVGELVLKYGLET